MLHKGLSLIESRMSEIEMDSIVRSFTRKLAIKFNFSKRILSFLTFSVKSTSAML